MEFKGNQEKVIEYGKEYAEEAEKYGDSARAYDPSREG